MQAATNAADGMQLGWMGLIIPVALAAVGAIVRAFTAETWISKDCQDDVIQVRDGTLTKNIRPVFASVVIKMQTYVDLSKTDFLEGEPGDPKNEIQRILASNLTFESLMIKLEESYTMIHNADSSLHRRTKHAKRIGIASSIFLLTWVYFSLWLCMPGIDLPIPISLLMLGVLTSSLGWIACEALGSARERTSLTKVARGTRTPGGSTR